MNSPDPKPGEQLPKSSDVPPEPSTRKPGFIPLFLWALSMALAAILGVGALGLLLLASLCGGGGDALKSTVSHATMTLIGAVVAMIVLTWITFNAKSKR
jgi:hypothetical protein